MHAERQGHLNVEDPTLVSQQIISRREFCNEGISDCMQAYKSYVKMIVTRTNTKTNIKYSEDPTIFALELANEPHTTDNYEIKRGIAPGTIIKAWIKDMVAFIRTLDTSHMVNYLIRLTMLEIPGSTRLDLLTRLGGDMVAFICTLDTNHMVSSLHHDERW